MTTLHVHHERTNMSTDVFKKHGKRIAREDKNIPSEILGVLYDSEMISRPLATIAREIRADWTKVYFGAVPYLDAMSTMGSIEEDFGADPGREIVVYFLANAGCWRGDVARRVKAELNGMLK